MYSNDVQYFSYISWFALINTVVVVVAEMIEKWKGSSGGGSIAAKSGVDQDL